MTVGAVMLAFGLAGCKAGPEPPILAKGKKAAASAGVPAPMSPPTVAPLPAPASTPKAKTASKPVRIKLGGSISPPTPEAIAAAMKFPAESDWQPCPRTENYPWPRSVQQLLSDVPPAKRRASGLSGIATVDPDGKISHLKFTNLSTVDDVNKHVIDGIQTWKYTPEVAGGKRVAVCSEFTVNVDFSQ